jgi:Protein of unknown function (DUF2783)
VALDLNGQETLADADAVYTAIVGAHADLSEAESLARNAWLPLLVDRARLQALAAAQKIDGKVALT